MGVFFKGFFRVIIDAEEAEVIRKEMHARFLCLFQVEARAAAWVKQGGTASCGSIFWLNGLKKKNDCLVRRLRKEIPKTHGLKKEIAYLVCRKFLISAETCGLKI